MNSLLVVCTGNICRSPMAEALFAAALPGLRIGSAGTAALVGHEADPAARDIMRAQGLPIDAHRARLLNPALCKEADLILVMEARQRTEIAGAWPWVLGKLHQLVDFPNQDVSDPYRRGTEAFARAFAQIDGGVRHWAERICQVIKK